MPRIRTIKPELWRSPQVMNLSFGERLLFIGLITQADDEGRGSADLRYIKSSIFPADIHTSCRKWLDAVCTQGLIDLYSTADGAALYSICNWKRHQKIDRPKKSNFPSPKSRESSTNDRVSLDDESRRIGSDQGSDHIKDQGSGIRSARARVFDDPARTQNGSGGKPPRDFPAEVRLLAKAGNQVGDIVKLLSRFHITQEQVDTWLGEGAPA